MMNPYALNLPSLAPKNIQPIDPSMALPALEDAMSALAREVSWSESDIINSYSIYGQNPDPVVKNKGLKIYQEMMEDDQVKVCVELKKQARLSSDWRIVPGKEDSSEAKKYADFIDLVLRRIPGTFSDALYEIYSAIEFGFSLTEKVFDLIPDGPFAGKAGLRALKTREPYNYEFKTDVHGNLLGIIYVGYGPDERIETARSLANAPSIIPVPGMPSPLQSFQPGIERTDIVGSGKLGTLSSPFPPGKFVIYSYNSQFGNRYGRSDLLAAFRWWLMKKHGSKFWAIWLERYASPFVWASVKSSAMLKRGAIDELDGFLKRLSVMQSIRTSDAVTITPVQFSTASADAYEKAIEAYNRYISHAVLCPNLLGVTGSQGSGGSGGSYSLGQKHFDAFMWVIDKLGRDSCETIVGEQIIDHLMRINFPPVNRELYPKFQMQGVEEEDIESKARVLDILVRAGLVNAEEDWVRKFLTLPDRKPGVELKPIQSGSGFEPKKTEEDDEDLAGEELKKKLDKKPDDAEEMSSRREAIPSFQQSEREPNIFEAKVGVKKFAKDLEKADEIMAADLSEEITSIRDRMLSTVEKRGILESGDPSLVSDLTINVGPLEKSIRNWMVKIHLDSKLKAFEELGRAGIEIEVTRRFALAETETPFEPWKPLPPQDAIDFFNRKVLAKIKNKDGRKVLIEIASRKEIDYYGDKAFAVAGVIRDDLLNDIKQILLTGIRRQDRASAIEDLKSIFNRYLEQGIAIDDELLKPSRLETIVRTNVTEALNQGRRAMYEDEDVKTFVEYFEYTAILDARTTEYCRCMDRKIFSLARIKEVMPPAHYNCRSFTVPITRFEIEDLASEGSGIEVSEPCAERMAGFSDIKREPIPGSPVPGGAAPRAVQPPPEASQADIPGAPKAQATLEAEAALREELTQLIRRCPYTACGGDVKWTGKIYNVGQFECLHCGLPFRVSNRGDLYLYDAGTDEWQRASIGSMPQFFHEQIKSLRIKWAKFSDIKRDPAQIQPIPGSTEPLQAAPKGRKGTTEEISGNPGSQTAIKAGKALLEELSQLVKRCPYSSCGGDIEWTGTNYNVREFGCRKCGLRFKVSDRGDLYLYDAGIDEWQRVTVGAVPQFFTDKIKKLMSGRGET